MPQHKEACVSYEAFLLLQIVLLMLAMQIISSDS